MVENCILKSISNQVKIDHNLQQRSQQYRYDSDNNETLTFNENTVISRATIFYLRKLLRYI